jgi:hypothetical protein
MSILDEIRLHVLNGNLTEIGRRDLRATGLGYSRRVYVSREINQECLTRYNEPSFRKLSAQLQAFIGGLTIPVALEVDHKKAEWARLEKPGDEVWETRVRDVTPELRVLGRFAGVDTFVALNLYDSQIRSKKNWNKAKERCREDWRILFPCYPPVFGCTINDYISANVTLI